MPFQDWLSAAALIAALLAIGVTMSVYLLQTKEARRTALAIFSTIEQIYERPALRREAEELAVDVGADIWRCDASPKYIESGAQVEIHLVADIGHTPNYCELECMVENLKSGAISLRVPIDSGKFSHDVSVKYPADFPSDASSSNAGRYDITWYAYDAFDRERHKVETDSFFVLPWKTGAWH